MAWPSTKNLLATWLREADGAIVAMSPSLFPRPPDWDPKVELCGALAVAEGAEPWTPEPALRAFLDGGPAPFFFSFGSMFNLDERRATESVAVMVEALRSTGTRGIIQAPANVVQSAPRHVGAFFLQRAPHSRLFPLCSHVVHHGGVGTAQTALVAGVSVDRRAAYVRSVLFAKLLYARGVAPRPLPRTRLSPRRLAERIAWLETHPEMTQAARVLGAAIAGERGAERAADCVERVVRRV